MPDPFTESPNFINPAYASPQQIASMRQYAEQLKTGALAGGKHPLDILASALMGYAGKKQGEQATSEEQRSNKQFAKELMDATASKDPAKLMEAMSNPRAGPYQALLLGKLMEWGPARELGLPGGVTMRGAYDPYFNKEPVQGAAAVPPQATVAPPQQRAQPAPYQSAVGDVIPGTRTTTGSPDSAFPAITEVARGFGFGNAGPLVSEAQRMATEHKKSEAAATLAGAQEQTAKAQMPASQQVRQHVGPLVAEIIKELQNEQFYDPLTGKGGVAKSQIPGSHAYNVNKKISDLADMITSLRIDQLTATNPNRRIFPEDVSAFKRSQGLDIANPQGLMDNLKRIQREYGAGGTGYETTLPLPSQPQGAFPAQAGEGSGFKILKVNPTNAGQ
jgi:hypothetical protein